MRTVILVSLLLFAIHILAATPEKLVADGGAVEMTVIGRPSLIKINGKGAPPEGEVQIENGKVSGEFKFELTTLDTGIELRDRHMREKYLRVQDHPEAVLKIKDLPQNSSGDFTGQLTLHGVTKPVSGKFKTGEKKSVDASFKVKLSEFNIDIPKYMGITVADEVDVKVNIASLQASK